MDITNIKVKTPSIPSRSAANQFIDQHGYDMLFDAYEGIYYVHDVEKDKLHRIPTAEITNCSMSSKSATEFMASKRHELKLRRELELYELEKAVELARGNSPAVKRGPGRPPKVAE